MRVRLLIKNARNLQQTVLEFEAGDLDAKKPPRVVIWGYRTFARPNSEPIPEAPDHSIVADYVEVDSYVVPRDIEQGDPRR